MRQLLHSFRNLGSMRQHVIEVITGVVLPSHYDGRDSIQIIDIAERIAIEKYEVGIPARLYYAVVIELGHKECRGKSGGLQRL